VCQLVQDLPDALLYPAVEPPVGAGAGEASRGQGLDYLVTLYTQAFQQNFRANVTQPEKNMIKYDREYYWYQYVQISKFF
jgi:hypothetical protein